MKPAVWFGLGIIVTTWINAFFGVNIPREALICQVEEDNGGS